MDKSFQLQNPLWRHIQRYATTAILFSARTKAEQSATAVIPNQPIVQAVLPETVLAEPTAMGEADLTQPLSRPVPTAPTVLSVLPAPAEGTSSPMPVQAKPDDKQEEDRANWNHLQAIIASHRAKRAAEEVAETALPGTESADWTEPTSPISPSVISSSAAPGEQQMNDISQGQRASSSQGPQAIPQEKAANLVATLAPSPRIAHSQERSGASSLLEINNPREQQQGSLLSEQIPTLSPPLEAVWPVQRVKAEIAVTPAKPAGKTPLAVPLTEASEPILRTTLNKIVPGQPTDSTIDFNPPRRPRPTTAPTQVVQRQSRPSAPPAGTVPTEIGPLPADLWQLLDQEPPTSSIPLASLEAIEMAVTPLSTSPEATSSANLPSAPLPIPEFEEPQSQSNPGQLKLITVDHEPDALHRISHPEERSMESQSLAQRSPDANPLLPDLDALDAVEDVSPFTSLPEVSTMDSPVLALSLPAAITEMIAGSERPSLPLPTNIQHMPPLPQLAQPELPTAFPTPPALNFITTPDPSLSMPQVPQLAQPELVNNLPIPPAANLPATPDTLIPDLPSLGNGTAVANNIPTPLNDLPTLDTLSDQDDPANEISMDEIARQVYRHLKRRLDLEWERTQSRR